MKYRTQPGVVLVSVCDENLLVTMREARNKTAYVKCINSTGAYIWKLLEQNMDVDQIVQQTIKDYNITEQQVLPIILSFIETLKAAGYLLEDGE